MKINFLYNKIPWFGKYSGYEYIIELFNSTQISLYNASENSFIKRLLGKILQWKIKFYGQTTFGLFTGYCFLKLGKSNIKHILYLENHLYILAQANNKDLKNLIATIHLPISQWKEESLKSLKSLKHAIFLYEREIEAFKPYMPNAKISFIHHGVNNDFFKPDYTKRKTNQILCVGHYLRDFETLGFAFQELKNRNVDLELHLIIPKHQRNFESIITLEKMKHVFFHENLSDEELLYFYQSSTLQLIPMIDSGANTAIIQSIACGLPIVTTNVGGINSYGGGSLFPVFNKDQKRELINYAQILIDDIKQNLKISAQLREFAVKKLDWSVIKEKHLSIYQSIKN